MIAPQDEFFKTQQALIALRELLSRNPCASQFGAETLADLLYAERHTPHHVDPGEVECTLQALRVEDEVLA